jgi:hypothetical protein
MRKLLDSAVRWLRHPRLTLASNAAFVVGAGIFVAGLVGGALKVLTTFPTVWLALSATGAFLLATGGMGMLVRAKTSGIMTLSAPDVANDAQRELERAIGRVLDELESAKGAVERAVAEGEWWIEPLSMDDWKGSADTLAGGGLSEAHKAARVAYRHIADLNSRAKETYEAMVGHYEFDVPPGRRPRTDGIHDCDQVLDAAIAAIRQAEVELERAQGK